MEPSVDIVDLVSNLLDSGNYKEALSVPNDQKYSARFKVSSGDLIPVIIGKIQDDTIIIKPSLHGACEELLSIIIQKAAPSEALLEFIEQIETAKNDAQFSIILTPLQCLLKTLSVKRGRSLEWCLNSITIYIEGIPMPEYHLEGNERLLMDCDPNVRRITRVYSLLPPFYAPFIKELTVAESNIKTKQIIVAFLISLLGKPLIYIEMDPECNTQSEARQCCTTIVQDICLLEKDILKFLLHLEICYKEDKSQKINKKSMSDNEVKSPYEHRDKLNLTTLSGLFYSVISGHFEVPDTALPQVYCVDYIVNMALLAVVHLLGFTEYGPIAKALSLCKALHSRLPSNVSCQLLSFAAVHFDLLKGLVKVAIYSTYETLRKNAVNLIGCHLNKFDYKGRCMLIKYLLETSNHSGMIGYSITLYKNSLDEAFKMDKLPDCFMGEQFKNMVKKICHLPHGAESDLVELADQIITSLNFLRYLAIKDANNLTGIKECFGNIEIDYLEKLRTGLNLSKAHYQAKLQELEEGKDYEAEVSINVGGNMLDSIPRENKKQIIHSALNAFHLIEGLVARLSECINVNRMQALTMDSFRNGRRIVLPLASAPINNTIRIVRNYAEVTSEKEKDEKIQAVTVIDHDDQQYEENVKIRILEKALEFVPKSGWSVESLSAGAEAAGYPGVSHGLFPNGGGDLVHHFNITSNQMLVEKMKSWPKEDIKEGKVPRQFLENAIMTRLTMIEPYKSTWPKAMAIQTLPNNVQNCLATLLSLVDDICYHSGDRSVNFNWYIRRVGLAGIYKAAELFYLTDSSKDNSGTRSFVSSRIRDAEMIQAALNLNPVTAAPQTLTAAFVTAKNILGINTLK